MKYERLTKRNGLCVAMKNCQLGCRSCDNLHCSNGIVCETVAEVVDRLAELEDKIERGELQEIPDGAVVLTREDLKDCIIGEVAGYDILQMAFARAERWRDEARKETAMEILTRLHNTVSLWYPHGNIPYKLVDERIKLLAEKYGVEVD